MILNGKVINPGQLNTKIVLSPRRVEKDAGGFVQPVEAPQIEVWCRWINAHGADVREASASGFNDLATVLIRYRPEVDETWRVIYRGRSYDIRSIDNIREKDEWMELHVARVGEA